MLSHSVLFTCLLLYAPLSFSFSAESGILTAGSSVPGVCGIDSTMTFGFMAGAYGSFSHATLSGVGNIFAILDFHGSTCGSHAMFIVSDMPSDPGRDWLDGVVCNGSSNSSKDASYRYILSSEKAVWSWNSLFGFTVGSSPICSISHH